MEYENQWANEQWWIYWRAISANHEYECGFAPAEAAVPERRRPRNPRRCPNTPNGIEVKIIVDNEHILEQLRKTQLRLKD